MGRVLPLVTGATLRPGAAVRLDACGHAWVAPPALTRAPVAPLTDEDALVDRLRRFADAAAPARAALLDTQPQGCGRDAAALARLATKSGVAVAAVTGFGAPAAYPMGNRPWRTADAARATFEREILGGMREQPLARPAAVVATLDASPPQEDGCWDAAIDVCATTGVTLLVRLEAGGDPASLILAIEERGLAPRQVYLCRADRHPDVGLHRELARAGVLLGYGGFVVGRGDDVGTDAVSHAAGSATVDARAEGDPAYAQVLDMLDGGFHEAVAIGLDLVDSTAWGFAARDGAPHLTTDRADQDGGPAALVHVVERALRGAGVAEAELDAILGGNVLGRTARAEAPGTGS